MNSVELIGRLTRDPDVRYTTNNTAVATFAIAIDRPQKEGQQKQTDFPRITVFGKQAETCKKYLKQGRLIAIQGRLQTGSYQNKNGDTVYTTDVVANRVEFIDWGNQQQGQPQGGQPQQYQPQPQQYQPQQYQPQQYQQQGMSPAPNQYQAPPQQYEMPDFEAIDEDVPY